MGSKNVYADNNTELGYFWLVTGRPFILFAKVTFISNASGRLVIGLVKSTTSANISSPDALTADYTNWATMNSASTTGSLSVSGLFSDGSYVHFIAKGNLGTVLSIKFDALYLGA